MPDENTQLSNEQDKQMTPPADGGAQTANQHPNHKDEQEKNTCEFC